MTDTISGDRAPRSAASIAIVARVAMSVTLTLPVYLLLLLLLNRMNVGDVSSVHRRSRIARHRLILLFFSRPKCFRSSLVGWSIYNACVAVQRTDSTTHKCPQWRTIITACTRTTNCQPTAKATVTANFDLLRLTNRLTHFDETWNLTTPEDYPPCEISFRSDNEGSLDEYPLCHSRVSFFVFTRKYQIFISYADAHYQISSASYHQLYHPIYYGRPM